MSKFLWHQSQRPTLKFAFYFNFHSIRNPFKMTGQTLHFMDRKLSIMWIYMYILKQEEGGEQKGTSLVELVHANLFDFIGRGVAFKYSRFKAKFLAVCSTLLHKEQFSKVYVSSYMQHGQNLITFNWDDLLELMEGQVQVPWDLVGMSSLGAVASFQQ